MDDISDASADAIIGGALLFNNSLGFVASKILYLMLFFWGEETV